MERKSLGWGLGSFFDCLTGSSVLCFLWLDQNAMLEEKMETVQAQVL